ncbi:MULTISPECIES: hypothetical protein [Cytobacillus]|uniref:hypothetical protein n=1 Tax=Cytobacillus TaxID=2675230 RepID=UPI0012FD48F2|nr:MULTISPECIES: hypothetical protein [Cytobacillus]
MSLNIIPKLYQKLNLYFFGVERIGFVDAMFMYGISALCIIIMLVTVIPAWIQL